MYEVFFEIWSPSSLIQLSVNFQIMYLCDTEALFVGKQHYTDITYCIHFTPTNVCHTNTGTVARNWVCIPVPYNSTGTRTDPYCNTGIAW